MSVKFVVHPITLKAKCFDIVSGSKIVVLNQDDALENDIHPSSRVKVSYKDKDVIAMVDLSTDLVKRGEIGLFEEISTELGVRDGSKITVQIAPRPKSIEYIKRKMDGSPLERDEIKLIIDELMENSLSPVEMAAFITAVYIRGLNYDEVVYLTDAIVESGEQLNLNKRPILDKHCIGGVANNRTTMLVVPIIAAAGMYIPKTSSRSITSAAGTADTMEVLAPVTLSIDEVRDVVLKTKGCIVWGGGMNIAAADDKLIHIRRPLSLDPRGALLASILAKKKSVGATHVIIDIPVGRGAKLQSVTEAQSLADDFIAIGKRINMKIESLITDGSDPIGVGIGPALECKDVLEILDGAGPMDLREKGLILAGRLLELSGAVEPGRGRAVAEHILESGKAMKKFREIIEAQGGDPNVKIDDLPIGDKVYSVVAEKSGRISHVDNRKLSMIARAAGSPFDKGAGIILYCEHGDKVRKGDKLFDIVAESEAKLDFAIKTMEEYNPIELEKIVIQTIRK
ncbi:AMP phosphorylase [Candidatus Micrarchaeota archaeon]|nr:AMP phosphorylase [Candidatus Micrarchaeota archaeon]